jgi:hypothetical protein
MVILQDLAPTSLRDKTTEHWRKLEFSAWFRARGSQRYPDDSPLARTQFGAAADRAAHLLFGVEAVAARRGESAQAS